MKKYDKKHQLYTQLKSFSDDLLISVFRYILAKDAFEIFYSNFLSKRLIHKKSEDRFKEVNYIEKLKKECG